MTGTAAAVRIPTQREMMRERLRDIIQSESLRTDRAFRLSAVGETAMLFDMKRTMLHSEGANLCPRNRVRYNT